MATRDMLVKDIKQTFKDCVDLVEVKNKDYATTKDAFANFKLSRLVGVSPARATLVRVADKLARVSNLLDKENEVKDETIEDTINDIINYMAILRSMITHESKA